MNYKNTFSISIIFLYQIGLAQLNIQASKDFVKRIVPEHSDLFLLESIEQENGKDVFEIESKNNKIVLRGNNGVAIASGLYYYLTEYANCQITWNGTNINIPNPLPKVIKRVHKQTPYQYRYYLNYCTFNYSMSWWNWERWQKEIDWMALHGINMPLAITGEEYTWYQVYLEMGFSETDLKDFFCGPAYFSWFWMGNLDGWGGPLPLSWMERQKELQQKIVKRERELGMKTVLPAFTGHVPAAFKNKFPTAKLKATNWKNGFADTYILDSEDPMFATIGKKFLETQTKLFGTDHLYSADTFNENQPPSSNPEFLSKLSARVYEGMHNADPDAIWVMQDWLFHSDAGFWKTPQIEALLKAVPDDKMIILDLASEIDPIWKRTESFYGKPWIWNMLHNFGGNVNIFGRINDIAQEPALALNDKSSKKMAGIGLTMEAIEQNPVIYELMTENVWRDTPIELDKWLQKYTSNRYGTHNKDLYKAWEILKETAYNGKTIRDGAESIITGRPTLDSATVWTKTKLNYNPKDLIPAWDLFVKASYIGIKTDGFQYDIVDITRQVLANYALPLQKKWVKSFREKNQILFEKYSNDYLQLISDMDFLLATRKDFMLGPWLSTARSCGTTKEEKGLYEKNARNLITLWGDSDSKLHEYSNRQWSGLLNDFYKQRWKQYFDYLQQSLKNETTPDFKLFEQNIRIWEWNWVNEQKEFTTQTVGNSIEISQKMHLKYRKEIEQNYK